MTAKRVDINIGVGDPDRPMPAHIVQAMHETIYKPSTHKYPPDRGTKEYRKAAADWMERRFGFDGLNPETEVVSSVRSQRSDSQYIFCVCRSGRLHPNSDPGYLVYRTSIIFAGGKPYTISLVRERGFLPDLNAIPTEVAQKAKLLWINYPNHPTGALAMLEFFEELVAYCKHYDISLCYDHAYSEMADDGYKPPSVLQVPGAKDIAIEFHSLSKSDNMTGWRVGFVVGNATGIEDWDKLKPMWILAFLR